MTAAATTQPVTTRHTPVSELHPDRGPGAAQRLGKVLSNVALLLVSALFAIPLLWVVLASLDPEASLAVKVPSPPSLQNFSEIATVQTTFRPLLNSLVLCGGAPSSRWCARRSRPIRCRATGLASSGRSC
ncbi:hypothetical protein GCM10027212_26280 [Actinotalea caeni]